MFSQSEHISISWVQYIIRKLGNRGKNSSNMYESTKSAKVYPTKAWMQMPKWNVRSPMQGFMILELSFKNEGYFENFLFLYYLLFVKSIVYLSNSKL